MLAQPIAGQISDRTRSRFGRRAPWIVAGALAGGLALVGLALRERARADRHRLDPRAVAYNFAQGPLSADPARPRARSPRRGTFAALSGIGAHGRRARRPDRRLDVPAAASPPATCIFAVIALVRHHALRRLQPRLLRAREHRVASRFTLVDFLSTFWVNPVKHPDFFWAFTGRLLLYTGYFAVTGYQFFILTDYFGLGDAAARSSRCSASLSLVGILIATLVSRPALRQARPPQALRLRARRSCRGLAFLVPLVWPDLHRLDDHDRSSPGFGFGMFQAVDTALMSEVLPSAKSFAKDLGVVNIAATLPQTLAPGVAGAIVLAFGGYAGALPGRHRALAPRRLRRLADQGGQVMTDAARHATPTGRIHTMTDTLN